MGRHVVPHGVHRVVRLVAVEGPVAGVVGNELDGAHLAHGNVGRHLRPARAWLDPAAIGARHFERMAVQMHRVVRHGEVAHADAHAVAQTHGQRVDAGKDAAVPRPHVEVGHLGHARRVGAGVDVVRGEQEDEIAVDAMLRRVFRVHDDKAHHAHRHLHHLVGMRVVHEGAGLLHLELVDEGLAGWNVRLRQAAHAVHAGGQDHAVPVHRGVLGQLVGHEDAHAIAFYAFDRRAGALAVVAPEMARHAGCEFALDGLGHEVELLPAAAHAPRQRPAVERDDGVVGPAVGRRKRRLRGGLRLQRCFGQRGRAGARDHRCAQHGRARATEKLTSGNHVQCPWGEVGAGAAAFASAGGSLPPSAICKSVCAIQYPRSASM
ncbi:hypothetical protein COLO4_01653 [Corchorus olitorius]|uniref:Uncharacterized protein n=1 Tax=Corchorus olitorius TaxID=93759 RepID=A0A1R3L286_9ROSI|nr:hypothetical protein COLO4_01653 [Corchorus olitorius]